MHDHNDEVSSVYCCAVHTKCTLYALHRLKKTANLASLPCLQKYAGFHSSNYNIGSTLSKKGPLIIV